MKPLGFAVLVLCVVTCVFPKAARGAQDDGASSADPSGAAQSDQATTVTLAADQPADAIVREGNRLLQAGEALEALRAYQRAESKRPDALEVAFDKALSHFALGAYDEAGQAFERAALSSDSGLSTNALYGLGAADHARALANTQNPQEAIGGLEGAMRRYRDVLSNDRHHAAARDAYYKAARAWRQLEQQVQEQQQQQDQQGDPQQNQKQDQQDGQQEGDQDNEPDQQQNQTDDQQPQPPAPDPSQEDQQDESQSRDRQQQQQQAQRQSREQAERTLRRLMDRQRQRKRERAERVQRVPVVPVDKDW